MKYSILLLFGSCLVFTKAITRDELKQTLKPFAESCTPPPDEQDYDDLIDNNPNPRPSTMCIKHCIFEKIGLYKDNKIDVDLIQQFYGMVNPGGEKTALEMANICNEEVKETDSCKAAHEYNMCGLKQMELRNISMPKAE